MKIKKYNCLILLLAVIVLTGCASSSYVKRYKKADESPKKEIENPKRFSSGDSSNELTRSEIKNEDVPEAGDDEDPGAPKTGVDLGLFKSKYKLTEKYNLNLSKREKLLFEIINYLETPYRYGNSSTEGTDCSGFTRTTLEAIAVPLKRSAREQYQQGESLNKNELTFGDLVFFNTRRKAFPGHVGIYLGDDLFVHASTSSGVIVSSLNEDYYKKRYVGARRVTEFEDAAK